MFYVIYNQRENKYVDEAGAFGLYQNAERFQNARDAEDLICEWDRNSGLRVVGPCIEGETP